MLLRRYLLVAAALHEGHALAFAPGTPVRTGTRRPAPAAWMAAEPSAAVAEEGDCSVVPDEKSNDCGALKRKPPFAKVMAANRAEIAVRIERACRELNVATVAVYGFEDRYSQHRWGADQSFQLDKDALASPVSAYLDIEQLVQICKDNDVDAVHPGYGNAAAAGPPPHLSTACRVPRAACRPPPPVARALFSRPPRATAAPPRRTAGRGRRMCRRRAWGDGESSC